jgi:hypothetical protein
MDGVAAVAAIFNIVLIITTEVQCDVSGMTTKRASYSFM